MCMCSHSDVKLELPNQWNYGIVRNNFRTSFPALGQSIQV
jgi:hypothetical protein